MALPTRGQRDWDDDVLNEFQRLDGEVQSAVSNASSAKSTAISAASSASEAKAEAALSAQSAATAAATASAPTAEVLEDIDADESSGFRQQQDARLLATYARPAALAAGAGIDPTGAADSTTALQAIIDACPEGGSMWLPNGVYKISAPLVVDKSMTIEGESSSDGWLPLSAGGSLDTAAELFKGVVVKQTTAGQDILQLPGSATSVNLVNLGLVFEGAHRFVNTGHGVNATPSTMLEYETRNGHDHGVVNAQWRNVRVFGHDGDHYAFTMTNTLLCTLDDLRAYGGGGLQVISDSPQGNYGNLVVNHPYMNLFCEGTAHGYHLQGSTNGGSYGFLGLIAMIRPQCNGTNVSVRYPETTPPTTAQRLFLAGEGGNQVYPLTLISPDFESPLGLTAEFGTGNHFIDGAGLGVDQDITLRVAKNNSRLRFRNHLGNAQAVANINAAGNAIVGDADLVNATDTLVLTGATKRLYLRCGSENYITLDPVALGVKMEKRLWLVNHTAETFAPAAGAAAALPATPAGYVVVNINGTNRRLPYY